MKPDFEQWLQDMQRKITENLVRESQAKAEAAESIAERERLHLEAYRIELRKVVQLPAVS